MKCLVDRIEYIFDVFTLTELVLNRHRNELTEEGATAYAQHITAHYKHTSDQYMNVS